MQWIDDNWKAIAVIAVVVYVTQSMLWSTSKLYHLNALTGAQCSVYHVAKLACW